MTQLDPGRRSPVACQNCKAERNSTEQSARVAGWRIWEGTVGDGSRRRVVLCVLCANGEVLRPDGTPAGWEAVCDTCGEGSEEETQDAAKQWCSFHECESETRVVAPDRQMTPAPA